MNQDSASLTRSKAFAVWVSTPSWIAPEKYRGEAISSAKDEVTWLNSSWNIRILVAAQDDALEIVVEGSEPAERDAALLRFAAIERDALGLLAKTHETEAEIRLDRLLPVVEADQRPADQVRDHRSDAGVQHGHPEHVARDRDLETADRQRDAAGEIPQQRGKGGERRQRVEEAETQGHRFAR